jgi:hypothetical protein
MEASVISLEWYQAQQAEQTFRSQVHQQIDVFLDRLEEQMDTQEEDSPPLWELTETVRRERAALTGSIVQAYVEKVYGDYLQQAEARCPHCSHSLNARKPEPRTVETLVGPVTLPRPYFYCRRCRYGFYPLDEALGLSSHRKQYDVQQAATRLALEMPYDEAETLFGELTDVSMSDCTMHGLIEEVGDDVNVLDVCPTTEEIQIRIAEVAAGKTWKPILVLAIDAANVPTRPEEAKGKGRGRKKIRTRRAPWKGAYHQAKGFRFFLVDGERIVHLLSWHQIQTEEEMGQALQQIKEAGLIPEEQVRLCAIADGDGWIWKWVSTLFPSARQILDFYHCASYIHAVAETQYGAHPLKAQEWLEATMARLFCNQGDRVVWGLQRLQPVSPEAEQAIKDALSYLPPRLEQIAYGSHRKGGYPIGSGAIESAHRFIGHVRLKRPGAWWYQENSNKVLALRCAKYNGTFKQVFQRYVHNTQPNTQPNT